MREAFSMITAIVVIVLMASVGTFILNLSGKMSRETSAQFQREQAVLLAKSYTEYAIMAVTANEHNSSTCVNTISGVYPRTNPAYYIDVNISYIGNDLNNHCARKLNDNAIATPKSPLNIIIDVFIRYPDYEHPDSLKMTYHKRSLQKI